MHTTHKLDQFSDIKILSDANRLAILRLLMQSAATLSQLGKKLDMSAARVRHHLKILENAGFVTLTKTRVVRGFVEKYYRASAQAYFINRVILPEPHPRGSIYAIGSHDPALELLSETLNQAGNSPQFIPIPVGSLDGLLALRQGFSQMAGCHLYDPSNGEYNTSYVRHFFPGETMHIITLAHRQQGLLVAEGNPLQIRSLADLARADITFVNRKAGSGTRVWLELQLSKAGIDPHQIRGYNHAVNTHAQVADAVRAGTADTGVAVCAATRGTDLELIPLFEERYDLVIPQAAYESAQLLPALEYLQTAQYRNAVASLGGYNVHATGTAIHL